MPKKKLSQGKRSDKLPAGSSELMVWLGQKVRLPKVEAR